METINEIFENLLNELDSIHDQGMQALKEYKLKNTLLDEEINQPITNS